MKKIPTTGEPGVILRLMDSNSVLQAVAGGEELPSLQSTQARSSPRVSEFGPPGGERDAILPQMQLRRRMPGVHEARLGFLMLANYLFFYSHFSTVLFFPRC